MKDRNIINANRWVVYKSALVIGGLGISRAGALTDDEEIVAGPFDLKSEARAVKQNVIEEESK